MKLKPWDTIWVESFEPKGDLPNVYRCWEINSAANFRLVDFRCCQFWPPKTPARPPKHPRRPQNDVNSTQGSCPKHPWEFWKKHFRQVGFRHLQPRGAQGWFTTGANPFSGLQIYHVFKTSRVDRYDLEMKKIQWEGGSITSLSWSRGVQRYDLSNGKIDQFRLWPLRGR